MPERQSRHSDKDLIDEMKEQPSIGHQGAKEGTVNTRVGNRDEKNRVAEPDNREPVTGQDNPEQDARKGEKTMEAIKKGEAN